MALGKDFWLIVRIVMVVLRALIRTLGDDDDIKEADNNGF